MVKISETDASKLDDANSSMRLAGPTRVNLIVSLKSPEGPADLLLPVVDTETFLGETRQHTELGDEVTDELVDEFLKEFEA